MEVRGTSETKCFLMMRGIACKASKLTLVCVDQPICQSRIYFGDKFKEKWIGGGA